MFNIYMYWGRNPLSAFGIEQENPCSTWFEPREGAFSLSIQLFSKVWCPHKFCYIECLKQLVDLMNWGWGTRICLNGGRNLCLSRDATGNELHQQSISSLMWSKQGIRIWARLLGHWVVSGKTRSNRTIRNAACLYFCLFCSSSWGMEYANMQLG